MIDKIVKTSHPDWLKQALELYTNKEKFNLIDDANIGLTPEELKSAISLIKALKEKSSIQWKEILAVLTGIGITSAGLWMVFAAISDPEPTSKLGLLITGGIILALTGSLGTLASLGVKFTVSAKSPQGHVFKIKPEK